MRLSPCGESPGCESHESRTPDRRHPQGGSKSRESLPSNCLSRREAYGSTKPIASSHVSSLPAFGRCTLVTPLLVASGAPRYQATLAWLGLWRLWPDEMTNVG